MSMYFPVHPELLQSDRVINFDIYLNSGKNYVLYVKKDQKYSTKLKQRIREKNVHSVYISKGQEKEFKKYLSKNFVSILTDTEAPIDVRAELLFEAITKNVKVIFKSKYLRINNKVLKNLYNLSRVSIEFLKQNESLKSLESLFPHDEKTYTHCVQVYFLTLALMNKCDIHEQEKAWTGVGSLLHDLGKLKIPSTILSKPGKLNNEEWRYMKKHPVLSFGSCTQVKMSQNALNAILLHHELCNGTGYPIGLQKNEIPLSVRILTFCDVFDAITSERPYAQKESSKEALHTIESEMQKSLDMSLFDDFAELVTEEACV